MKGQLSRCPKAKRFSAFILVITLIMAFVPVVGVSAMLAGGEHEPVHATGLIWDSWEVIEANLREDPQSSFATESVLPPSVNLTTEFPAPGNQGQQLSCVPWAVAYALKSCQENAARSWGLQSDEHLFSPGYVYNQINGGDDDGSTISSAMRILVEQGVSTLASFPYDESDYLTQPTTAQKEEAAYFRVAEWYSISGIDSIKRRLTDGDGVVVGIEIYPDFDSLRPSNPIYDVVSGTERGGHAICLIGYDDEMGAFKFINSWGTGWGLGGYGWISYDLMEDTRVSYHGAAVGYVMDPRPASIIFEDPFHYTVSGGEATIVGYAGLGGKVVIPGTLGGYPVTEIGNRAFQDKTQLTGVVIPNSVTRIGRSAFVGCTSLARVDIGNGVTFIDNYAFQYLPKTARIYVPNQTIKTLAANSGFPVDRIIIIIDSGICGDDLTWEMDGQGTLIISGTGSMTNYSVGAVPWYSHRNSITKVIIDSGLTSVASGAFSEFPITVKIHVTSQTIKTLVIDSGFPADRIIVADVASGVCGDNVIWELDSEGTLLISGTGNMWGYSGGAPWRSHSSNITKVVIDSGVTSIGSFAFSSCTSLTSVVISDSVTLINYGAFYVCTSLTKVVIPDSVTSIGSDAFKHLSNTARIYVPNQAIKTLVVDSGFYEGRVLMPVVDSGACGDNLTWELGSEGTLVISGTGDMWDYSSSNAPWHSLRDSITTVVIDKGVTSVFSGVFSDLPDTAIIYVPNPSIKALVANSGFPVDRILISIVDSGDCGDDLTWTLNSEGMLTISGTGDMWDSYIVGAPSQAWYFKDNIFSKVVIDNGVTSIGNLAFYLNTDLTDVVIPDSVTSIGDDAFYMCYFLTNVVIPDSVTSIGSGAFSSTGLTSVVIPDGVTEISSNTFSSCRNLTSVVIPDSVTAIGRSAFSGTGISSIVIPAGVTVISDIVFYSCPSLTSVSIPDSVLSIGNQAFYNCTSLTSVVIPESVTSIGDLAFYYRINGGSLPLPNLIIHCYENSYAHNYAIENGINYVLLGNINVSSQQDESSSTSSSSQSTESSVPACSSKFSESSNLTSSSQSTESSNLPSTSQASSSSVSHVSSQPTQQEPKVIVMRLNAVNALLDGTKIAVDPTNDTVAPFTLMSKTMVPVRFVENLDAVVKYYSATEPVTVTYGNIQLTLEFGKDTMTKVISGGKPETVKLPTAPSLVEGKTCVPIREIAEAIGFSVKYDSGSFVIVVSTEPLSEAEQNASIQTGVDRFPAFIVGVKGITAKKTSYSEKVGDTIQLEKSDITFDPVQVGCDTLVYSSNNQNIATVTSNGRIKAEGKGTAKITVSSHNGKTAIITVTVT